MSEEDRTHFEVSACKSHSTFHTEHSKEMSCSTNTSQLTHTSILMSRQIHVFGFKMDAEPIKSTRFVSKQKEICFLETHPQYKETACKKMAEDSC